MSPERQKIATATNDLRKLRRIQSLLRSLEKYGPSGSERASYLEDLDDYIEEVEKKVRYCEKRRMMKRVKQRVLRKETRKARRKDKEIVEKMENVRLEGGMDVTEESGSSGK